MKTISFIKENCISEFRTILTPKRVKDYIEEGFTVYAERGIGNGIGINDSNYCDAGAIMVDHKTAWTISNYVVKYKAPEKKDFKYFRSNLHFASFLHAEGDYELSKALVNSGMSAYAYEFIQTPDSISPISIAPAEVAGKLSIIFAAYHLLTHQGGFGKLLGNIPGASQCKVVVIGYGDAGHVAIQTAAALGAKVVVFGRNSHRLRRFESTIPEGVKCHVNSLEKLMEEIKDADLIIGAILISTYDTEAIITKEMVQSMKKGSLIIDVTAGYGPDYIETFDHNTTLEDPVFEKYGVLHCKIDNMCAASAVTSSESTEAVAVPILIEHGNYLYDNKGSSLLQTGIICKNHQFVHPELIKHMEVYRLEELKNHVN